MGSSELMTSQIDRKVKDINFCILPQHRSHPQTTPFTKQKVNNNIIPGVLLKFALIVAYWDLPLPFIRLHLDQPILLSLQKPLNLIICNKFTHHDYTLKYFVT